MGLLAVDLPRVLGLLVLAAAAQAGTILHGAPEETSLAKIALHTPWEVM